MSPLILVRDPQTGDVIRSEAPEPQPFGAIEANVMALMDTVTQQAESLVRLRRLVLEVASLGVCTDEDRVSPPTPGHLWLEMPTALWDRVETEASRGLLP